MLSENDIQQLEDYQYNRLSSSERKAVEQQMKKDPVYKKEAKAYLRLYQGFQIDKLSADMERWDKEQQLPQFFQLKHLAVAASVSLFIAMGAYLFQQRNSSPANYAHFYEAYKPLNIDNRGGKAGLDSQLIWEAQKLYKGKKYAQAIPLLAQCSKVDCQIMLGVALLETKKENEAKAIFRELSREQSISLEKQQIASWYLALTLVKTEEWTAAEKELEHLLRTAKEGYYIDQAKALKARIKAQ